MKKKRQPDFQRANLTVQIPDFTDADMASQVILDSSDIKALIYFFNLFKVSCMKTVYDSDEQMITSEKLMAEACISRATLNNYIRLGLLPRPVVRRPSERWNRKRTVRIGYFPREVLERLKQIQKLKREGSLIGDILVRLGTLGHDSENEVIQKSAVGLKYDFPPDEIYPNLYADMTKQINRRISAVSYLLNGTDKEPESFAVLTAKLHDAQYLSSLLPNDEYLDLLKRIIDLIEETLKNYYGVYQAAEGFRTSYIFLKNNSAHYILDAISAALKMKEDIKMLSGGWGKKKGCSYEIFLNMGIAAGFGHIFLSPSLHSLHFTSSSDAIELSDILSVCAIDGSIWVAKDTLERLNAEEKASVIFGIKMSENDSFVRNAYGELSSSYENVDRRIVNKFQSTSIAEIKGRIV